MISAPTQYKTAMTSKPTMSQTPESCSAEMACPKIRAPAVIFPKSMSFSPTHAAPFHDSLV
jgi:hypothetical protein